MKRHLIHIASFAVLMAGTLAVFWFNASSASQNTVTTDENHPPIVEDVGGSTVKDPVTIDPNQTKPSNPNNEKPDEPVIVPPEVDPWQTFLESLATAGQEMTPLLATKELSFFDTQRLMYTFAQNGALTSGVGSEKKSGLWLYQGLLLFQNGDKTFILDAQSDIKTDITGYLPVYTVTTDGSAVFYKNGSFYVFDPVTKAMAKTDEPPFAGLYYDNAPAPDGSVVPYYDAASGLWGYLDQNGKTVIAPAYRRAFPFGKDGVAAVQKTKTSGLIFIDKQGKTVFDSRQNLYPYNGIEVYDLYSLPESLTENAVGQLFFSKGYICALATTYATHNSTEALRSRWVLVNKEGKNLSLPEDYTVRSYSEGVAVLEKNGHYGYYSCEGYWIVDPIYQAAEPFMGGIGVAVDPNGGYHAFDNQGNELFSLSFDYLSSLSCKKMLGYRKDKGWMLFTIPSSAPTIEE